MDSRVIGFVTGIYRAGHPIGGRRWHSFNTAFCSIAGFRAITVEGVVACGVIRRMDSRVIGFVTGIYRAGNAVI
jgi:hypothetical protein